MDNTINQFVTNYHFCCFGGFAKDLNLLFCYVYKSFITCCFIVNCMKYITPLSTNATLFRSGGIVFAGNICCAVVSAIANAGHW